MTMHDDDDDDHFARIHRALGRIEGAIAHAVEDAKRNSQIVASHGETLAILLTNEARREERARVAVFAAKVLAGVIGLTATVVGIFEALG